jgi:hypothetical protein
LLYCRSQSPCVSCSVVTWESNNLLRVVHVVTEIRCSSVMSCRVLVCLGIIVKCSCIAQRTSITFLLLHVYTNIIHVKKLVTLRIYTWRHLLSQYFNDNTIQPRRISSLFGLLKLPGRLLIFYITAILKLYTTTFHIAFHVWCWFLCEITLRKKVYFWISINFYF